MRSLQLFIVVSFFYAYGCAAKYSARRHRQVARSANIIARNNTGVEFKLQDMYKGDDFLNQWDFFDHPDPTHGLVDYVNKAEAIKEGLAFVNDDGTAVLAVDDKTQLAPGSNRKSVRISSKKTYNGGLFIADFWAMPHGCSVWPAYWSVGPNWPAGGEIDVLEGVHDQPTNTYTLHTSSGCTTADFKNTFTAEVTRTQCASSGNDNAGCGFRDGDPRTYGHNFNVIAGGVYAHLWNREGIKVWHFARPEVPEDIKARKPDPSTWGKPAAFWSNKACPMEQHFFEHSLVIDTTLCGDLGNPTYAQSGCPGTCAERVADPANFKFAKWMINYIAVYQP